MENISLNLSEVQFGAAIAYFRKERKMSYALLASQTGLTVEDLKSLESNRLQPDETILAHLTTALDIPYQVFILEATLRTKSANKEENRTRSALMPVFDFLTRKIILE